MGSCYAKKAVDYALDQVGYQCGPNKWNKYADQLDAVDYFTGCGSKQNLDFCAVGVNACIFNAVVYPDCEEDPEAAKWAAHYFMYQSDSCDTAAVVKYLYQFFADNDAVTDNPERGDIAIFQRSNGVMYHCGIVTDWDNDSIYITEFNTEGGQVLTHAYAYGAIGNKIKCFCRPRYDGWEESSVAAPAPVKPEEPKHEDQEVKKYKVINIFTFLNVREGPGTEYKSIWKLENNDTVPIYEIKNGWGRIDDYGWVCMNYLREV